MSESSTRPCCASRNLGRCTCRRPTERYDPSSQDQSSRRSISICACCTSAPTAFTNCGRSSRPFRWPIRSTLSTNRRGARRFRSTTRWPFPAIWSSRPLKPCWMPSRLHARVHFRLGKKIPMGGGLGGGSSNAAAVLLALPVLAGRPLPFEQLAEIGAELGSDVPFFLTGGTAVGIGRGTEVYEIPDLKPEPILVISSGLHVATGPAYQALRARFDFRPIRLVKLMSSRPLFECWRVGTRQGRRVRSARTISRRSFSASFPSSRRSSESCRS